jgi:hypothetical protein
MSFLCRGARRCRFLGSYTEAIWLDRAAALAPGFPRPKLALFHYAGKAYVRFGSKKCHKPTVPLRTTPPFAEIMGAVNTKWAFRRIGAVKAMGAA